MWGRQYKKNASLYPDNAENKASPADPPCDIIHEIIAPGSNYPLNTETEIYRFEQYCHIATNLLSPRPVLLWWIENQTRFLELSYFAFDLHSISATSVECERVSSSAGQLLTKSRNQLLDDIVEAN